jgi:predicted Zn-dependent protease
LFSASIQSFRQLSAQEADRIQPYRITFYTARSGDSWESLAKQGGSGIRPATLAIMNGYDPGTPPRAGARLRTVAGG